MISDQTTPAIDLSLLIQQCIKGERQAQNSLYKLFAPKMFGVCLRYCKTRHEAEEVLQEGFIKVFEFIQQFKFNGSFEGWIRKIMVNSALQKYRSKPQMHALINHESITIPSEGSEDILSRMGTKELLELIQQLPPSYRMVFNLYVFEGLKHKEIARLLHISEGTSKSNLFDARSILQKAISKNLMNEIEKSNCL